MGQKSLGTQCIIIIPQSFSIKTMVDAKHLSCIVNICYNLSVTIAWRPPTPLHSSPCSLVEHYSSFG